MGLLSNIGSAIKSVATGTKELFSGGITQLPKNIVQRVEDKVAPIIGARPFTPEEATIIKTTAVAAGALAAAPVAIAAAPSVAAATPVLLKIAQPLVSTPARAITTALVAPVVATAVITNPIGAAKTVEKTVEAQLDLGKTLANPSIEAAKEFVSEHPIATAAGAAGAALLVGKVAAPLISGALSRDAIQDQTKALIKQAEEKAKSPETPQITTPLVNNSTMGTVPTTAPVAAATPVTPKTELIATTGGGSVSTTKRKRRAVKPQEQRISQRVNVIVANQANSKETNKYLNRSLLAKV